RRDPRAGTQPGAVEAQPQPVRHHERGPDRELPQRNRSPHGRGVVSHTPDGTSAALTGLRPPGSITPSQKRTCVLDVDPAPGGPGLPFAGSPWEDPGLAQQALQEPARPVP